MKRNFYFKQLLLLILICNVPVLSFGQVIYSNTFTGVSACPTPGNIPTVASNAKGTPLFRNTISCMAAANVFNSSTINNTAVINNNSYIQFAVTASAGYQLNVTSLSFFSQGSLTAPNQIEVRYSTDGFATSTSWGAAPTTLTAPGAVSTWDFADFTTIAGGTVTFRIYPYGTQRADLGTARASASATIRLDNITLNGTVITPMPVKLISFNGDYDQNVILLKWETAWEDQNEGFEIQRSNDAIHFNKIGYVQGNATTKLKSVYGFTDTDTKPNQTLYFRLKQFDLDENYEFSRILAVNTSSEEEEEISVYPNPNKGIFILKSKDANLLNIHFFNALGKEMPIKTSPAESSDSFKITSVNSLVPGIYEIKINADNSKPKSIKVLITE
jgi:hypothetical protein